MRYFALLIGSLAFAGAQAQQPAPAPSPNVHYRVVRSEDGGPDRAALGIGTSSTGKRDTLGLLVTSVTANSPADKAGIVEGDRIASINSTSLKVAPADAGERDMNGVMTRRLVRTLGDVKAGDDVTLVLYTGSAPKTVKVKTAARDEIFVKRENQGDHAALGIGFGGGSMRDTLGLFVSTVARGGPAEKAGIEEGNRIAAINGVDLRVPAVEASEGELVGAKMSRLSRVLDGVKPGDAVELKVYANGGWKTIKVTTVKSADLFGEHNAVMRSNGFGYGDGPSMAPMPPMPPMAPMAPMHMRMEAPMAPDASTMTCVSTGDGNVQCTSTQNHTDRAMRHAYSYSRTPSASGERMGLGGNDGEIDFGGLRLTRVTPDLASYFGAGSEKGLLVLDAADEWQPVKTGDVVLTLNGRAVQRDGGQRVSLSLESGKDNTFGILRKGKKMTIIVKAH